MLGVSALCQFAPYALHSVDAINVDPIRIGLNQDSIRIALKG